MGISYSLNEQQRILTIKVVGYLYLYAHHQAVKELVRLAKCPHDVCVLWDLTEIEFDNIDIEFIQSLIDWYRKRKGLNQKIKVAIVSDYWLGKSIIQIFMILAKELNPAFRVFVTADSAREWLCGNVS